MSPDSQHDMKERSSEPLISVALCTYNGARYLREQLETVLAQTHRSIEIVAVDDASTDSTLAILREYEARHACLRVIANTTNLGFRRNFERAMSLCTGELIAPCDQDDSWSPDKLSTLLAALGDRALVYCDSELVDEQARPLGLAMSDVFRMISTDDPAIFVAGNCVSGHAMLFRTQLLRHAFPVPDCFFHDWWLAAVAASRGGVGYCDRKLVKHRRHGRNASNLLTPRAATRIRARIGMSAKNKMRRNQGYRWTRLREFRARLEHLAMLPGASREFLGELSDLWDAREEQWVSPELARFMFRHGPRLYALRKTRSRTQVGYWLKFAIGLRLKRMFNPYGYAIIRGEGTAS